MSEKELLQAIIETSHEGIIIIGENFKIEMANDRFCELFGYPREGLLEQDFRSFLTDESKILVVERYRKRRKGEAVPNIYEFKGFAQNGSIRTGKLRVSLVTDNEGNLKTLAHVLDVTEEKEKEKALRETRARYKTLVETMYDGLAIDDEDGCLVYVNQAFCDMLGYKKEELIGKKWYELTYNKDESFVQNKISERKSGEPARYELDWVKKSGEIIPSIISAMPYKDAHGKFEGTFAVITEIASQKEAEDTVQFLLDLLTHDISNQLQVIITSAGLLDANLPDSYIDDARQDILDSVDRCNRLITKLKRAGQLRFLPSVDIDLTKALLEKLQVLKRIYDVELIMEDFEEEILVRADTLLGELIWNLLENSVRHNPIPSKKIWVTGEKTEKTFSLHIADNGPGISDIRKRTIFDRTRRGGGGIGLTLVSQMVRKYGGKIEVEDRVEGKSNLGTKFILTLKLV
jgi:PAS domain S-box-containing protein